MRLTWYYVITAWTHGSIPGKETWSRHIKTITPCVVLEKMFWTGNLWMNLHLGFWNEITTYFEINLIFAYFCYWPCLNGRCLVMSKWKKWSPFSSIFHTKWLAQGRDWLGLEHWRGGFVYNVDKKGHMRKLSQKKSLGSSRDSSELDETKVCGLNRRKSLKVGRMEIFVKGRIFLCLILQDGDFLLFSTKKLRELSAPESLNNLHTS